MQGVRDSGADHGESLRGKEPKPASGEEQERISIEIGFPADFAYIFEVPGAPLALRGEQHSEDVSAKRVLLSYPGLDGSHRTTSFQAPSHRFPARLVACSRDLDDAPNAVLPEL